MASYDLHPEAADEYLAATPLLPRSRIAFSSCGFVAEVESAIQTLLTAPTTWRIIEEPQIRLDLCGHAPEQVAWLLA